MFNRNRRREPAIGTLIGNDTRVHGDLEFVGGCLIDGFVMGNVRSDNDAGSMLSVSARGCVEGTIEVPNVLLNGTVKGDVRALQRVELGSGARVHGNVEYGLIEMAIGAEVNGKLVHVSAPAAVADGPARAEPEPVRDDPAVGEDKLLGESR
jgi:cytoskeletal protein CcmA (bactofilin family)